MAVSRPVGATCYFVVGLISIFAFMASIFYLVGAVGLFHDPPHTRVIDGVVFVVLFAVGRFAMKLANWFNAQGRQG